MIADRFLVGVGLSARALSIPARVKPAPNAPTRRKLRRDMPSQNSCLVPQKVNISQAPQTKGGCLVAPRSPGEEVWQVRRWYSRSLAGAIEILKKKKFAACGVARKTATPQAAIH